MWEWIFALVTLGIILLPLLPGILELTMASDVQPLKVIQEYDVDITYFAKGFRSFMDKTFPEFATQKAAGSVNTRKGILHTGMAYQMVGQGADAPLDTNEININKTNKLFLAADSISLPQGMLYESEIYSAGWIKSLGKSQFRALLAEGDISLGENSTVMRWVHSECTLYISPGSYLYGRASAAQKIMIADGCQFERLNAPKIMFGEPVVAIQPRDWSTNRAIELPDIATIKDFSGRRWLVNGDIEIPSGTVFNGDIVATRHVTLGAGCHIIGSVKSNGNMLLKSGARVDGSVFSAGDIVIELGCQILGPVVAEEYLTIQSGTVIGSETIPTTVSGKSISIAPGVVTFGTVWAEETAAVNSDGEFTL